MSQIISFSQVTFIVNKKKFHFHFFCESLSLAFPRFERHEVVPSLKMAKTVNCYGGLINPLQQVENTNFL